MLMDIGILIIRVLFGLAIAAHGTQKLSTWFGGYGIKRTGGFFENIGFHPGAAFAAAAGLSETGGGALLTVGLFTPFGAAAVLSAMLVAMVSVHLKNGFFATGNGIELPFLYSVAAFGCATALSLYRESPPIIHKGGPADQTRTRFGTILITGF